MTSLGNIVISHYDPVWKTMYYLCDDMTFTTDQRYAARCYLLKPGDTAINNGDRISINCGNRTLVVDTKGTVKFMDRELIKKETSTFIVTNGTPDVKHIWYASSEYFLITNKDNKMALRCKWYTDLVDTTADMRPELISDCYEEAIPAQFAFAFHHVPHHVPQLIDRNERNDRNERPVVQEKRAVTSRTSRELIEQYKNEMLLLLLMITLVLCIFISK